MTFWMIQVKITLDRRQSKMLILSTNVDQKSSVTDVLIVIVAQLETNGNRKHCF